MDRYLAIVTPGRLSASAIDDRVAEATTRRGMVVHANAPGLFLAASPALSCHHSNTPDGLFIGTIFEREGDAPISAPRLERVLADCHDDPSVIMKRLWGDFIAILPGGGADASDRSTTRALRSPFARIGCLHAQHAGRVLVASDSEMLGLAGLPRPDVDAAALAHCIAYRELPSSHTCLQAIGNLSGGRCLAIDGDGVRESETWSPWSAADRNGWVQREDDARDLVRGAVLQAVKAQAGSARKRLLLLSGGVDSSILAASLATLGGEYACLNLVRQGGAGDERHYAQAVANRLGCELIEAEWRVEDVDVTRSDMALHPSPVGRSFMQGTNRLLARIARETGADLTLDGGGGDNVFCALQSVAPVVDAWRFGGAAAAWRTACSIAALAETGIGEVLRKAAARRFRRAKVRRWPAEMRFLAPSFAAQVPALTDHPWFEPPQGSSDGTMAHVAVIASAQGWAEQGDLLSPVHHVSPLASLPVVEACLRVPSWWWYRDGRNRVIARDAFATRLPTAILARRAKGAPDDYLAEIHAANRIRLREMLLDGRLAAMGMLDRPALETVLASAAPVHDGTFLRVLYLAEVEAWLATRC